MHTQEGVTPKQQSEEKSDIHTPQETTTILRALLAHMSQLPTRDELKKEIAEARAEAKKEISEAKYELKDHVSREIAKTRDVDWRINEKTNEFVRVAQKSGTISKKEGERLIAMNPLIESVH